MQNGTLASVTSVDGRSEIAVQTRGAFEREVHVDTADVNDLRLAYAKHVYKAQSATADEVGRIPQEQQEPEEDRDRDRGHGIE